MKKIKVVLFVLLTFFVVYAPALNAVETGPMHLAPMPTCNGVKGGCWTNKVPTTSNQTP